MAFTSIGLGGVLTFNANPAMAGMQMAKAGFQKVSAAASQMSVQVQGAMMKIRAHIVTNFGPAFATLGRGFGQMKMALKGLFVAAIPFTYGLVKGLKSAAEEQKELAGMGADMNATKDQMDAIHSKVEDLAISGWHSGDVIVEAMRKMATMGAKYEDVMKGIGGVTAFAGAAGVGFSDAAEMMNNSVRTMGLEWDQANRVADVFAVVSNETRVSMKDLAKTFAVVGSVTKNMGYSLEESAAIFGTLSMANQRGSKAAMNFQDMTRRLFKPGKKAKDTMQAWGISLTDTTGKFLPMNQIIGQFKKRIDAIPNAYKRAQVVQELFGMKGGRTYNALSKNLATYEKTVGLLATSVGAAEAKADKRYNNIIDSWKRFKKDLSEGAEMFMEPVLEPINDMLKGAYTGLEGILFSFKAIEGAGEDVAKREQVMIDLQEKYGDTLPSVAMGFWRAAQWMKEAWTGIIQSISDFGGKLKDVFGPEVYGKIAELIGKFGAFSTILIPIGGAVALIALIVKRLLIPAFWGVIGLIKGMGMLIRAAFTSPLGIAFMLLIMAIAATRKEGEGIMDTFKRVFDFLDGTIGNFIRGFMSVWDQCWLAIKQVISAIGRVFDALFGWLFRDTTDTGHHMKGVFWDIGRFIGRVFVGALKLIAGFFDALGSWILSSRENLQDFFANVEGGWAYTKKELGMMSEQAYEKKMKSLAYIKEMTDAERTRRQRESAAEEAKQKALEAEMEKQAEMNVAGKREKRVQANVNVNLEDKRQLEIKNSMCVNGKEVAWAVANQNKEIQERAGFKANWWQRRAAAEYASSGVK